MEVISGIISGILLLTVLVTFPLGLRARKRTLREIAELGSALEKKTESLVKAVESLVREEEASEPPADELRFEKYETFDIKVEPMADIFPLVKDTKTWLYVSEAFLEGVFCSFIKEFSLIGSEEPLKVFNKMYIAWEDVGETIGKGGGCWYFSTPRYSLVDKEHVYARR